VVETCCGVYFEKEKSVAPPSSISSVDGGSVLRVFLVRGREVGPSDKSGLSVDPVAGSELEPESVSLGPESGSVSLDPSALESSSDVVAPVRVDPEAVGKDIGGVDDPVVCPADSPVDPVDCPVGHVGAVVCPVGPAGHVDWLEESSRQVSSVTTWPGPL